MRNHQNPSAASFSRRKLNLLRVAAVLVVVLIVALSASKQIRRGKGDIVVFVHAASHIVEGADIYRIPGTVERYYIYPPLYAVLNIPFAFLPVDLVIILWSIFSVFLIGWIVVAWYEVISGESFFSLPARSRWIVGFFSVLLASRFLINHLTYSQANLVVVALVVLGIRYLARGRAVAGGAWVGISIMIKLISLPFSVWLLARREVKALVGLAIGGVAAALVPALFVGFERNLYYHQYWLQNFIFKHAPGSGRWAEATNFSPHAVVHRLFGGIVAFERDGRQYDFTIFQAPEFALQLAGWFIIAGVVGAILLYEWRYGISPSRIVRAGGAALTFTLMPLFSTVTETHHFVALLPACVYVIYVWHVLGLRDKWFLRLVILFFVLTTLTTPGIWGVTMKYVFISVGAVAGGTALLSAAIFRAAHCLTKHSLQSHTDSPSRLEAIS